MSLLIRSVDGEPLIEGVAEQVEQFSTALLAGSVHTDWLHADDKRIVLCDGTRTVIYRVTEWAGQPVNDDTFVTAELISDTALEGS